MFSCGFPVFSSAPGGRCLERPVLNIGALFSIGFPMFPQDVLCCP